MKNDKPISKKQQIANKLNAIKAGVKTREGKDISKFNALKHGCLTCCPLKSELSLFQNIKDQLELEFQPNSLIEFLYIERIAIHVLQLNRISIATNEFNKSVDDPRVVETDFDMQIFNEVVVNVGYKPVIHKSSIETLLNIYSRYETSTENRLYRAVKELNNLRN